MICFFSPKGIIIDPASYWGDREVDIAMSRLFGGFNADFYSEYELILPLSTSAKERTDIYNLYHVLNHANLFGGSYQNQCITTLRELKCMIN